MHGWGGNCDSFRGCANAFSKSFNCVLFSFLEKEPLSPLTLNDYADFVKTYINNLEADSIVIVGHSFGGRIAIRLAADGFCDKLILVDSAGLKPRRTFKYYYRRFKYKLKKFFKMDVGNCGSQDYRKLSTNMKKTFNNIVNEHQNLEIKKILCPTLIFWGEKDRETPLYMAKYFKKNLSNCGLVVFKGAGHYSYIDEFYRFVAILSAFLRR